MRKLIAFVLIASVFASCHTLSDLRIEKRRYRKGYYVHVRPHRYTEPVTKVTTEPALVQQTTKAEPVQAKQESDIAQKVFSQSAEPPVSAAPSSENQPQRSVQRQVPPGINRH